tara:strand:- start:118 stop:519 length:402 start_codon:yes stop_codon:yes gene_type:complete
MSLMPKKINLDLKEQRQALIFGVFIALVGIVLYSNGIIVRDAGWLFKPSLIFSIPCLFLGFVSGLIFFSDKNKVGIFLPFLTFFVHYLMFGEVWGNDIEDAFEHVLYLILSTLIALFVCFLVGIAIKFIEDGK